MGERRCANDLLEKLYNFYIHVIFGLPIVNDRNFLWLKLTETETFMAETETLPILSRFRFADTETETLPKLYQKFRFQFRFGNKKFP